MTYGVSHDAIQMLEVQLQIPYACAETEVTSLMALRGALSALSGS